MNRYVTQLKRLASAYKTAEAGIIAAFFKRPRRREDHLTWLRAQAYKEYSAIKPIFTAVAKLYPELDRCVDRHDFEELTEKLADETRHARLVMDLLEELTGRRMTFRDLLWLPEDKRLAEIRGRYSRSLATLLHGAGAVKLSELGRSDETLERAAITLTEGGGGALYRVCSRLSGDSFDRKIAAAFGEILADELKHKNSGRQTLEATVKTRAAYQRAANIIAEVSSQRLRMRNEQFGFPVPAPELERLGRRARQTARRS